MTTYAYLRVSTKGQTTEQQLDFIQKSGYKIDEVVTDHGVSGTVATTDRPEFKEMMAKLKAGDTIVLVAIDRLGRNAANVLATIDKLQEMKVNLYVMSMGNTNLADPNGKFMLQIMAAVAENERNTICMRIKAKLDYLKSQGVKLGRKFKLEEDVYVSFFTEGFTNRQIADELGVTIRTVQMKRKLFKNV